MSAGGDDLDHECEQYFKENTPLQPGNVAITFGAGSLCALYIFHATVGRAPPEEAQIFQVLQKTYDKIFASIEKLTIRSIAIPLIGGGCISRFN